MKTKTFFVVCLLLGIGLTQLSAQKPDVTKTFSYTVEQGYWAPVYCQNDQGCNGNEDLLPEQSAEEIFILFFHCFFLTHVYSHLRQSYS